MEFSAQEQYMLELVNRMRMSPASELPRLVDRLDPIHSPDADVNVALRYFQVNGNVLAQQWSNLAPAAPLAWSVSLHAAAVRHSERMIAYDDQEHRLPGEAALPARVAAEGYTGYGSLGENIFAYAESALYAHAAFAIDWGPGRNGLQSPPDHRENIMDPAFEEIGIGIVADNSSRTDVGPLVVTQDFGWRYDTPNAWLLGVVFRDQNSDAFYTPGEGLGDVTVTVSGSFGTAATTSLRAGGYQIALAPGTYSVTFSGGSLAAPVTRSVSVGSANTKLDLLAPAGDGSDPEGNNVLTGDAGPNLLDGRGGNDRLNGLGGSDTLLGGAGDDTLDGGPGNDSMIGGAGNDWYFVDTAGDIIRESADEGTLDRVFAGASYTLGTGVAIEVLSTTDNAGTAAINLAGNELANTIYGNAGNNIIDGSGGADVMVGLAGDDWYFVDNAGDRVSEARGGGSDRIFANTSWTLTAGADVENLSTADHSGTRAIHLAGNEYANLIYGNDGGNILDGGRGADTLIGLAGDDLYWVDNRNDDVLEAVGGGSDRVLASVDYRLGPGTEVETLTTDSSAGTRGIALTGNELANVIAGNDGDNDLDGGLGADLLYGLGGNDFYWIDNAGDQAFETAGGGLDRVLAAVDYTLQAGTHVETLTTEYTRGTRAVSLTGNELSNTVVGNDGDNTLNGGAGRDWLYGLNGADSFRFDTALSAANIDSVMDFTIGEDRIVLENDIFSALAPGALSAAAFRLGSTAADADDRILYSPSSGALAYDPDGLGGASAQVFAYLDSGLPLHASDFIVT